MFFFFKQKTAYEMRISDWSSDVCSSDLLAALHGQLRMAQRLLRAGCDPDLRDALNRTPREIAVMRGFVDVAAEFAPLQSGVSMARFLRDRGYQPPGISICRSGGSRELLAWPLPLPSQGRAQIGRSACRDRGCPYGWISVVAGPHQQTIRRDKPSTQHT